MSTYEPGAVAVATVRGKPNVRVMRRIDHHGILRWEAAPQIGGWLGHADENVTDVRVLVVLDPDVASYAATALEGSSDNGDRYCAKQIRDAMPKSPRIPEPGLWGVVEAHAGRIPTRRWVRHEEDWWVADTGDRLRWEDLDNDPAITLVRPGIEESS